MTLKRMAREEVPKGVLPTTLTIPLLESEIFSVNLYRYNVYLKVNKTASGSQGEKNFVYPALRSSRAAGQFTAYALNGKRMRLHLKYPTCQSLSEYISEELSRGDQVLARAWAVPSFCDGRDPKCRTGILWLAKAINWVLTGAMGTVTRHKRVVNNNDMVRGAPPTSS